MLRPLPRFISVLLMSSFTVSCVDVNDFIPSELPHSYTPEELSRLYYTANMPLLLEGTHDFQLELRPRFGASIQGVSLTISGTQTNLSPIGTHLYRTSPPTYCASQYNYYGAVTVKRPFLGTTTIPIGSAEARRRVSVPTYGNPYWATRRGAAQLGEGFVTLSDATNPIYEETVTVRNLRDSTVLVGSVGFVDIGDGTSNSQFVLSDLPTLPKVLACGESITFRIEFVGLGPTFTQPVRATIQPIVVLSPTTQLWSPVLHIEAKPRTQ